MARVREDEIARIKSGVSIARLAEAAGVALHPQGRDLLGCCPFHDDTTPSLVISPEPNLWHCLGECQAGGSVIDWVMRSHGVSFRHAVELLRSDAASLSSPPPKAARSRTAMLPPLAAPGAEDAVLLDDVISFYHQALAGSADAMAFLHRRKIADPEAVTAFRLGFCDRTLGYRLPRSKTLAGDEVRSRLRALGIVRESGHEHFRGCLVIPAAAGQVGEVYGRRIDDHLKAGVPRHLYLPGPHRGVLNPAAFTAGGEVIVCESLIDALTLWCAGFRHVTASYGAEGWTDEHTVMIREHKVSRLLIAYDGDPAGDAGARSLAAELAPLDVECLRVPLPAGADINDIAVASRSPRDALGVLLHHAVPPGHPAQAGRGGGARDAGQVSPFLALARESEGAGAGAAQAPRAGSGARPMASHPASTASPRPGPEGAPGTPHGQGLPAGQADAGVLADGELVMVLADRRWRVRGLDRVSAFGVLRVNLLAARAERFHIDTLDLYSARARQAFITAAAAELGVSTVIVKADLGKILLASETRAEQVITAARQPRPSLPPMSEADRAQALALLRAPDLAGRITADFATAGIAGEAGNCLVLYLAAVSRKLNHPLAVIVQSSSAAGKSALMDAALAFVPPEDLISYSAMTGQSLFYLGETDLAHKVLAIAEEEGASRASYALKLLQSAGQLSIASTGKDPASGKLVTHTYTVRGPAAIVLTTTSIEVDEELLNRCLVLAVDEDREQTRAIHAAQRHARTLDGLISATAREHVLAVHRNAQRLLAPVKVINPWAGQLTFSDARTRARRDHGKYLALIEAVTLLHQHQRERKTVTAAGTEIAYIETTPADIAIANRLACEVLGRSLDELPPGTRRLLDAISGYVRAEAGTQQIPPGRVRFTRRKLRESLGWSDTALKVHLARLADLELVTVHPAGHGGGYSYQLAWQGEGEDGTPFLIGLADPAALTTASGYDPGRSVPAAIRSAPGPGPVSPRSAPGLPAAGSTLPQLTGHLAPLPAAAGPPALLRR